jgi:hypothetical protein
MNRSHDVFPKAFVAVHLLIETFLVIGRCTVREVLCGGSAHNSMACSDVIKKVKEK